jgi:hypothetical protein
MPPSQTFTGVRKNVEVLIHGGKYFTIGVMDVKIYVNGLDEQNKKKSAQAGVVLLLLRLIELYSSTTMDPGPFIKTMDTTNKPGEVCSKCLLCLSSNQSANITLDVLQHWPWPF